MLPAAKESSMALASSTATAGASQVSNGPVDGLQPYFGKLGQNKSLTVINKPLVNCPLAPGDGILGPIFIEAGPVFKHALSESQGAVGRSIDIALTSSAVHLVLCSTGKLHHFRPAMAPFNPWPGLLEMPPHGCADLRPLIAA